MVSLKDIAGKLGVGVSTVSAVLNGKDYCYVSKAKKKLIIDTSREMGYVPNQMSRGMQGLSTKTIGIIGSLFSVPIMSELIESMNKEIAKAGYSTMLGDSYSHRDVEHRIINEFLARGVDGLLINSTRLRKELDELLRGRIPYVAFNKEFDGLSVNMDREGGVRMGVDHLIKVHGREKIAFVAKGLKTNPQKLAGYKTSLDENGMEFKDEYCIETNQFDNFNDVAKQLAHLEFDAIFASNDMVAGMLMKNLLRLGKRIPEDISIIGFDGIGHICELTNPILTSIKDPTAKVAEKSVELLLKRVNGEQIEEQPHVISPEWKMGESCGCREPRG